MEYGTKIDLALRAVAQLHKDASKLLVDLGASGTTGSDERQLGIAAFFRRAR